MLVCILAGILAKSYLRFSEAGAAGLMTPVLPQSGAVGLFDFVWLRSRTDACGSKLSTRQGAAELVAPDDAAGRLRVFTQGFH